MLRYRYWSMKFMRRFEHGHVSRHGRKISSINPDDQGKVEGSIKAQGHLIIAPGAVVDATIVADKVTSYGVVTGDLTLSDCLEMKKGAIQKGNVSTPNIMVDYGCRIDGLVRMAGE